MLAHPSRFAREHSRHRQRRMTREDLVLLQCIGRGAFGEVRVCYFRTDPLERTYVVKIVPKELMLQKNHVAHVRAERDLMVAARREARDNQWLVQLLCTFQDAAHLYFVMEFCQGGDLMWWLIKHDIFPEPVARFYAAEMVLAVHSLHQLNYAHRDLKPDNVLVGRDGHIRLTDFGFAKRAPSTSQHETAAAAAAHQAGAPAPDARAQAEARGQYRQQRHDRSLFYSTVGSPGYIAPEVLLQRGHGPAVDWWAVGVILYEMLYGYPPFYGDAVAHTGHKIARWRDYLEFPTDQANVSADAVNLIKRLVCDAEDRISFEQIVAHPFFRGVDWATLRQQQAPFEVKVDGPRDTRYFDAVADLPPGARPGAGQGAPNAAPGDAQFYFYGFTSKGDAAGNTTVATATSGGIANTAQRQQQQQRKFHQIPNFE
jgi:serine/threonine protein kinase